MENTDDIIQRIRSDLQSDYGELIVNNKMLKSEVERKDVLIDKLKSELAEIQQNQHEAELMKINPGVDRVKVIKV